MKALKAIIILIFTAFASLYLYFYAVAPIITLNQINKYALADSVFMRKHPIAAQHPNLMHQIKEKAFLDAQLSLSKADSIGLVINLKDSTASLVLKGVTLRRSKIDEINQDLIFKGINGPAYSKLFSKPLVCISDSSTVVKAPIEYHKAPKDTIEAMQRMRLPDSLVCEPGYYSLNLNRGIRLVMVQSEEWTTPEEIAVGERFKSDMQQQKFFLYRIKDLKGKETPDYIPTIVLKTSKYNIRAIYRGLPDKVSVVLTY